MSLIVQKFGGASVATSERVKHVAARVAATRASGHEVIAVVSAMGDATDDLLALAREVNPQPPARELDMLMTAGERVSMSLLAIALHAEGVSAMSLTGSQAGILTDNTHGEAKIQEIRSFRVQEGLDSGHVVIVAGFQGVDPDSKEITTLGRGGSDTTAVALAAAHEADLCEIRTDVDGVYSADPRTVHDARLLAEVSYEEMLELAASGARVLSVRAVEFAWRYGIPVHVRSSFHDRTGTWIREQTMEQMIIRGVARDDSKAQVTVRGVPDQPGVAARLFEPLAEVGISVDMIVQNVSSVGSTDISFTVPKSTATEARSVAETVARDLGAGSVDVDEGLAKVSVVGSGMRSHPGVAAMVFRRLADSGINIEMISTSEIRVSCMVAAARAEDAVRALHDEFDPPTLAGE